jgi:hypothetical protein
VEVQCSFGFVWFKDFEKKKEGQWAQDKEIRTIWPLKNLKPLFDEESSDLNGYITKLRWPLAHASRKLWECIYHSIYVCWHTPKLFNGLNFEFKSEQQKEKEKELGRAPWFASLQGRRACWSSGMGLGRLTSNSITHMDLHKLNNKLISV